MKTITFTEFRKFASTLISEVENGEVIQIMRHGKPVAELGPIHQKAADIPVWKKPGLRLSISGASLSKAILQERSNS